MQVDTNKLRDVLRETARQVKTEDSIKIDDIRTIAGFDVAFFDDKAVCAVVVIDFKTMAVLESKYVLTKPEIPYIPGFLAFREGNAIMQAYYDLDHDPDVLMVDGHGIAHPMRAGLACYVGVEAAKPCIGVAKKVLIGEIVDDKVMIGNEVRGLLVKTKEHAKPVIVSPGHLLSVDTAVEIVKKCIVYPHKLPEPLHQAHRLAEKMAAKYQEKQGKDK
ncbi:MAG: endonuclease V [Candidatus Woesearchaeota archaeon]